MTHPMPRLRKLVESLESRLLLATFNPTTASALTTALTSAQLGDTIILAAGTTYNGWFNLPNKTTGSGWITIQSSNLATLPGAGVRVGPANAADMPKLQSAGSNGSVITTSSGAHHYKFIGVEFIGPANNSDLTALMSLGNDTQNTVAQVPHDFVIDRCYFHPNTPTASIRRAVAMYSAYTDVINTYIEEIHQPGSDSQALGGYNDLGPFNIINNHLEGGSENIMFGGATGRIPGAVPGDIVIRGNYVVKPLAWVGKGYNTKNLFELKCGNRVLVEGNIFENCWADGQSGVAIVLKLGDLQVTNWNTTEDIIFRNNIVKNAVGGVTIQGRDYDAKQADGTTALDPGGLVRRLTFTNNVFEAISAKFLYLTHGPKNVVFDHNTIFNGSNLIDIDTNSSTYPITGFRFTNNIGDHNSYGVFSSIGIGNAAFNAYMSDPGSAFDKNVVVNVPYAYRNNYTARPNNYYLVLQNVQNPPDRWPDVRMVDMAGGNYRLASNSTYKNAGTDGFDIGANIDLIATSTAGVLSGVWSASPFAAMSGSTLILNYDGTNTPITLGTSGSNITATKSGTTLSFATGSVKSIFAIGTSGDDVLQLSAPMAVPLMFSNENGNDGIRVMAGTQTFSGDIAQPIRNVTLTVDAGATAVLSATQHLGGLVVNGTVTVPAGGNKVLLTKAVTIGTNGVLNLVDNDMAVDYTGTSVMGASTPGSYSGVTAMVVNGRNGGSWNGKGIVTSLGTSLTKTLGVAEASSVVPRTGPTYSTWFQSRVFAGQTVDDSAVVIKYTYVGDATLDGRMDSDDYFAIDAGFNAHAMGFGNGDFNYSAAVDSDDYFLIDYNYNKSSIVLSPPAGLSAAPKLQMNDPSDERLLLTELL